MWRDEAGFTEQLWMRSIVPWPIPTGTEGRRKGTFEGFWITRINAAARLHGLSYSRLMDALRKAHVELDRKILADLAVSDPGAFSKIAEKAKASIQRGTSS